MILKWGGVQDSVEFNIDFVLYPYYKEDWLSRATLLPLGAVTIVFPDSR